MKRVLALITLWALLLTGCGGAAAPSSDTQPGSADEPATRTVFAMDTFMDLRVWSDQGEKALDDAEATITTLDAALSVTNEESEIYALNHASGAPVSLSDDTFTLLSGALALSERFGPALELTVYPVLRAWGFTTSEYHVPTDAELAALLPQVDDSAVTLDAAAKTARLPAGAEIDLGAVAKGYAADLCAAALKARGVPAALLGMGSSTIRTIGTKPDGTPWRVAVQAPFEEGYAGVLSLGEAAVNTSGGYERFFEENGEIYWHILDPETGYPAKSGLLSATVVTEDALTGDALSTALFVKGLEDSVALWREKRDFEFVLIGDDGTLYVSEGLKDAFAPYGAWTDAPLEVIAYED